MSAKQDILTQLETALRGITVANGYQTDAGRNTYRNLEYEIVPETDLFPCNVIFPGELQSGDEGDVPPSLGEQNNFLPVKLEGFIEDDERGTEGHKLEEDYRKAITAFGKSCGLVELIQGYNSGVDVRKGDSYWSYVSCNFTIFFVTPWGEI